MATSALGGLIGIGLDSERPLHAAVEVGGARTRRRRPRSWSTWRLNRGAPTVSELGECDWGRTVAVAGAFPLPKRELAGTKAVAMDEPRAQQAAAAIALFMNTPAARFYLVGWR